jgi:putative ABC transport system permease protein
VLLTPKAPKSGKKVILERIPLIWKALSFKYKSTCRNVLLFKSRFLMTVVSVIGATVLVFAGMGLLDCTSLMENTEVLMLISGVLIVFSAVLCALVIYNLTNINVSERTREIATLMVLGYDDNEVSGYIFREIYIMSAIGAVLGVPLGVLFIDFVFALIDFGSLGDIRWWSYVLTPCLTMLFSFLSTLLLRKKITKTDMIASLKTIE